MLDLYHATRDELIRIILDQGEALADQERRIAALAADQAELRATLARVTTQLGSAPATDHDDAARGTPPGMPGLKSTEATRRAARPRKQRARGVARRRMQATEQVVHALAACPDCGAPLAGGSIKRTREVIDLPPPQVMVTAHVYLERRCPDCGRRCVPPPGLTGIVPGQGRFGTRLVSLIAVLREDARLPVATIQRLLGTLAGLHLSAGAIIDAVGQVAARAEPALADLQTAIRASPVVHADETGWREAGRNGYVWTFSTPESRLFIRGSRAQAMVPRVLGETFAGVLVSDFYTAYTGDDRMHQYCWAHLLRDVHELVAQHPEDPALRMLGDRGQGRLYHRSGRSDRGSGGAVAGAQAGASRLAANLHAVARPARAADAALCPHAAAPGKPIRVRDRAGSPGDQQRRRAQPATASHQPQDQRWNSVSPRHPDQDGAGVTLRHLAGSGPQSLRRLPRPARVPSTLNSYMFNPGLFACPPFPGDEITTICQAVSDAPNVPTGDPYSLV